MNSQYLKHRLAKSFFKAAFFGPVLMMALWGWTAEASPGAYEPAPEPTVSSIMAQIAQGCFDNQALVLEVTDRDGRTIFYTFLCQFKFMSEKKNGSVL